MSDWVHALRQCGERGLDAVLVTVLAGKGSIPREAGVKMVVAVDAAHGTIGGGELEYQALDIARRMLRAAGERETRRFPLGASLGQVCGGAANLAFERVEAGAPWVKVLGEWLVRGAPCAIVTPSAADDAGRLVVSAAESWGSLGSSTRDAQAIRLAREVLAAGDGPRLAAVDEGAQVIVDAVRPVDFDIVLFGAGHVGRALVRVLATLPCRVAWIDARAGEFPPGIPDNVRRVVTDAPLDEVASARPGSHFLVLTHSHALDFALVEAVLRRGDFAYCGMIGSATKRRSFENGLTKHGVAPAALARLTCPIGIAGLKSKEPSTIAVAVAAQLLELRERAAAGADNKQGGEGWTQPGSRRA